MIFVPVLLSALATGFKAIVIETAVAAVTVKVTSDVYDSVRDAISFTGDEGDDD
jgi:hypothetical protein